jgi:hypothetical protein
MTKWTIKESLLGRRMKSWTKVRGELPPESQTRMDDRLQETLSRPTGTAAGIWRRRIAVGSTVMGVLFFTFACFTYLRYFSDPAQMHVQERLQHAHILGPLWSFSLFGSVLFGVVSLFGLGWSRWTGVLANGAAFVCALMSLGAACGPFGCS